MPWTVEQLADLVVSCQKDLGELKYTNLAFLLQSYPAWERIIKDEKSVVEGGTAIDFNISLSNNGTARGVDLYEEDDYNVSDSLTTGTVPWKHLNANYTIERTRMNMNASKRRLINEVELARARCMGSLAEYVERIMWSAPVSGSKDFYGLPYWIVRWTTGNATPGFTGTNPDGFSAVAGLDTTSATYAQYRNYAGQYTELTQTDLVDKWLTMAYKCRFKSPIATPNYDKGSRRFIYYTNWDVMLGIKKLLKDQNDAMGFDLDPVAGRQRFQGNAIEVVPQLDSDAGDPIYAVDWSKIGIKFLAGEEFVEQTRKAYAQHKCVNTDIDATLNTWCADRRGLGVLSKTSKTGTSS